MTDFRRCDPVQKRVQGHRGNVLNLVIEPNFDFRGRPHDGRIHRLVGTTQSVEQTGRDRQHCNTFRAVMHNRPERGFGMSGCHNRLGDPQRVTRFFGGRCATGVVDHRV